jgi:adenylate cyclase
MAVMLDSIRSCFEGIVPSVIATCAADGTPNVTYLSQVHFVDHEHVALSFQFFNKTRENVLANPHATVQVIDPETAAHYRLALQYLRTETEGPLFEKMKAKLAGIASHTGMSKVFRLQGADVYRVRAVDCVFGKETSGAAPRPSMLAAMRACSRRLSVCTDLAGLLDETLVCLETLFAIRHSMLLMLDENGERLFTVASRGYPESGIGSEIHLGEGVIGVAARERTPIRIGHMTHEYLYSRATRKSFQDGELAPDIETEIPLPGLAESRSQVAVPLMVGQRLLGVLYVESAQDLRFTYEDEDMLVILAEQLAMAIHLIGQHAEAHDETASGVAPKIAASGAPTVIRHYAADHSVFVDDDYLIKGVAGAIFWKLLGDSAGGQRTEFSNRELRLDPSLRLPDIGDNLEARLILLQRRLAERCQFLRIVKTGRGRFRLQIDRPVRLVETPAGARG